MQLEGRVLISMNYNKKNMKAFLRLHEDFFMFLVYTFSL